MAQYLLHKGIAYIKLSNPPVNSLSKKVRVGIMQGLDSALRDKADCVVLHGDGKAFSAGADIAEFATGKHMDTSLGSVLERLDAFDKPIVSYITGVALGGGLETALSTHWRYASPKSALGLPEVHLGILPGAGGTQRLPRLCGVSKAVEIMTSSRMLSAKEALDCSIVDKLSSGHDPSVEQLQEEMLAFTREFNVMDIPLDSRRISLQPIKNADTAAKEVEELTEKVGKNARGFLAPPQIVRAVGAAVEAGTGFEAFQKGLKREGELFQELAKGPQARALQYFFFSERKVNSAPKSSDPVPTVKSVGIIGGGTMGSGIAMSFLNAGISVTLIEMNSEVLQSARDRIEKTYKSSSAYRSGKMTEEKVGNLMDKLNLSTEMNTLADVDMVIEAVFENTKVKQEIFAKLDTICKPDAILATNTSCLDVDEIAAATTRRQNVVGTHFFSPANIMKLLEIVRGADTSTSTLAACVNIGKKIGKVSAIAGNCYGFIGNRMLEPYGREAVFLLEEGCTPAQVDRALKSIGMAMGFFEMSDLAGNDVSWRQRIERGLTGPNKTSAAIESPPAGSPDYPNMRYSGLPDQLCEAGRFGQKTGGGWYDYDPANPRKPIESKVTSKLLEEFRAREGITPREISDQEIIERCLFALINEGFRIVDEGIANNLESVDVVYVYGYGFPRQRGGPMFWAKNEVGYANVLSSLQKYADKYPNQPWLKPSNYLEKLVNAEEK